jgi:hypothetical protein
MYVVYKVYLEGLCQSCCIVIGYAYFQKGGREKEREKRKGEKKMVVSI